MSDVVDSIGGAFEDVGSFILDPLDVVDTQGLRNAWGDITGETAADAAREASQTQLGFQQQALDYLREREELPMEIRDAALQGLQDVYLGEGRADMIADIQNDPFYQAQLQQAEQGALRGASASGLLRSGAVPQTLSTIAPRLLQDAYRERIGGIQGLAGLPSNANQIAGQLSNMGTTQAQGLLGAAQAEQAGMGNLLNLGLQGGQLAMMAFSDPELKDNVKVVGEYKGLPWCEWTWNDKAKEVGLSGDGCGVMADDVLKVRPELIHQAGDYMMVDYGGLYNE
ncbi:MAG: hypothetical protein CMI54_04555 [Parcubacteria group bacterium]|nr:hypothetical protein [Parcubacteria group bacterium]|tara:strand:+ start:23820 stop:24668 length:849 start_codon:yes stop_codon:yes gene_type:complete